MEMEIKIFGNFFLTFFELINFFQKDLFSYQLPESGEVLPLLKESKLGYSSSKSLSESEFLLFSFEPGFSNFSNFLATLYDPRSFSFSSSVKSKYLQNNISH